MSATPTQHTSHEGKEDDGAIVDEDLTDQEFLHQISNTDISCVTPMFSPMVAGEHGSPIVEANQAPRRNAGAGGFRDAFPDTTPAPSLGDVSARRREEEYSPPYNIPEHYRRHWEKVPDVLKNVPIRTSREGARCMTPTPEHEGRMYSESKCFSLVRASSTELLAGPHHGPSYCFVAETTTEIPLHIQETIYFFNSCLNKYQSQDRSPYVVPTKDVGLQIDRSNKKTVTGLFAKGERPMQDQTVSPPVSQQGGAYISVKNILEARLLEQPEETRSPITEIRMFIQFTGVELEDSEGTKIHKNYCVLTVIPASNFFMWLYIHEGMLVPPKMGGPQYAILMDYYSSMKGLLEKIINYELVVNLGVLQQDHGGSDDYKFNPGGSLGVLTILSPFQVPIKIFHTLESRYPGVRNIQIMGIPKMSFRTDDLNTTDWITCMHNWITANQRLEEEGFEILQRYNMLKDKSTFELPQQKAVGGMPWHVARDGTVTEFGVVPYLPITLSFNAHGIRSNHFDVWFSSIGGGDSLPDLVRALLRSYMVDIGDEDEFPDVAHFLRDSRRADPVLLFNTYFSPSIDPFKSLIIVDSQRIWWYGFVKDLRKRRENGTSMRDSVQSLENYVLSTIQSLEGMVKAGVFRSKTISQMQEICEIMDFADVCVTGEHSIRKQVKLRSSKISPDRGYDYVYVAWDSFANFFSTMNHSLRLNPANLVCAVQMLVTRLLHKFGGTNDTWTYFFITMMIMSGNGHFEMNGLKGPVTDRRKPNTTGADFTVARVNDIITTLYDILGVPEKLRFYLPLNCTRFTKTSWEQMSFATATGSDLLTQPPSDLTDRPITVTELRQDSMEAVIVSVLPRGEKPADSLALNICDRNKTGVKELASKRKVDQPNVEIMCTNTPDLDDTMKEHTKSVIVVSPTFVPGSSLEHKKRSRLQFQDVARDATSGRHCELEDPKTVAHYIAYSHILTAFYCGLINRFRSVPCEINQTVVAYIEWATFYLQHYGEGVMDQTVRENISRMVQGYITRTLGWFVWIKAIGTLSRAKNLLKKELTIKNLLLDLHADALPIVAVPVMLTCLMSRAVHMGSLLMTMLIAKELAVPIISWDGLNEFFNSDQPPTEPGIYMDEYNMIRSWIGRCIEGRRFCPAEEGDFDIHHNVSCYITDEGRDSLLPLHETSGFMRFSVQGGAQNNSRGGPPPTNGGDDNTLFQKMATRIQKMHGMHLFKLCHMGPERCVYMYALMSMATKFLPDFRGLGSPHAFCSAKHMRVMGFGALLPGIKDHTDDDAPMLAKQMTFKERDQVKSVALGVNPWSILSIVSLARRIIVHPSASDEFADGLVTQILAKAPSGCTPGNICPTSFYSANAEPVRMFIPSKNRPTHFLRPDDNIFPNTGLIALAKGVEQFLPEDLLHCPAVPMVARTLGCKILQVPSTAIKVPANLGVCGLGLTFLSAEPVQPGAKQALLVPRADRRHGPRPRNLWRNERVHHREEGVLSKVQQDHGRGGRLGYC
jgi:hypothetical protein